MYALKDYFYNGLLFLNNQLRPRHKKLSQLMIYATSLCQSRCKHCSIWQKAPEHLSLEDIKKIVSSRCISSRTVVGLEGGEFVLHPEAEAIMQWLQQNHPNYTLLSNCLAAEKTVRLALKYKPTRLYISLDGDRDTYINMRGRDGYGKVIEVIEKCKDHLPISLMFCLSPWNSMDSMRHVIDVAKKYNIDVRIGIYGTMDFFDTKAEMIRTNSDDYLKSIPENIHSTDENYDFVALYDEWINGHLRLRCNSVKSSLVIHSNGNVPLCQNLDVVLGNIHQADLSEIINSQQGVATQCKYANECNKCWINFHRKYDIILVRNLERIMPKWLVEKFYGSYQWDSDPGATYADHFKRIEHLRQHQK